MTRMKSKALILLLIVLFATLLFSSAEVSQDQKKSGTGDKESQVEKEVGDVQYGGGGGWGGGGCRKCCNYGRCRCCYPNEYPAEEYNEGAEANYIPEGWGGGGHGGGYGGGGRGGGYGGGGRGGGYGGGGRGGGRGGGWGGGRGGGW